jgi:hypothetical protein
VALLWTGAAEAAFAGHREAPVALAAGPALPHDVADRSNRSERRRGVDLDRRHLRSDGRVYTITFTASDGHGASCSGATTVEVRRHKHRPAVDSPPPSYDSLGP